MAASLELKGKLRVAAARLNGKQRRRELVGELIEFGVSNAVDSNNFTLVERNRRQGNVVFGEVQPDHGIFDGNIERRLRMLLCHGMAS